MNFPSVIHRIQVLVLLAFFLLYSGYLEGQQQQVADSLRQIYMADTLQGVEKMELLNRLAYNEINDLELALMYADELISLADPLDYKDYLSSGHLQKGNALLSMRRLSEALEAFGKSAEIAALDGDKIGEGIALMSMGGTYSESGDMDKAAESYEKSIDILRDPEVKIEPEGPQNLAIASYNLGELFLSNGDLYKAEAYFLEARRIFAEENHRAGLSYSLGNLGRLNARRGQPKAAIAYLKEAIRLLEEDRDYIAASEFQVSLAQLLQAEGEYQEAHRIAQQSLGHALRLGTKDRISESSRVLASLDSITGNFEEAYVHLNLHMRYKDSMDVETVDLTRFEREKAELVAAQTTTELELQTQKRKRERAALWATGATALLLIFLALGTFGRYRYMQRTNKIISAERDRSEGLLLNILPKETAQELKEKGRVKAQRFDAVTVLFTDFQGFTKHAESLDPEKLIKSLDHYFGYFDSLMDKYGLEKIKTVGDAYMCASGLPFPSEDHAHRMVKAAMDMLEFVEASKADPSADHIKFDVRIGINSGPVVAGIVGTKKFAYDIWGDTVNIAARMESTSEVGRINVAEGTYQLIKDAYDCEYRGEIDVKNRGKLNMYFVLEKKSRSQSA